MTRENFSPGATAYLSVIVGISAACLLVTLFQDELSAMQGDLLAIVDTLHIRGLALNGENTLGAWWQGMLLLLASLHFVDGYFRHRPSDTRIARAWLLLGLVALCLSIDEIGSIHERAALYIPPGGWRSLVPFAVILGGAAAYAIAILVAAPLHRRRGIIIGIAFVLFATVALQEELEHTTRWWGEMENFRTAVEEGTETLAMLLLLAVGLRNSAGVLGRNPTDEEPVFAVLAQSFSVVLVVSAICAPLAATMNARLPDLERGHPASWLAAAVFFAAALTAVRPFLRTGDLRALRPGTAIVALLCIGMSMVSVEYNSATQFERKLQLLLMGSVIIAAVWTIVGMQSMNGKLATLMALALIVAAGVPIGGSSSWACFLAYSLVGLIAYAGNHAILAKALLPEPTRRAAPMT